MMHARIVTPKLIHPKNSPKTSKGMHPKNVSTRIIDKVAVVFLILSGWIVCIKFWKETMNQTFCFQTACVKFSLVACKTQCFSLQTITHHMASERREKIFSEISLSFRQLSLSSMSFETFPSV